MTTKPLITRRMSEQRAADKKKRRQADKDQTGSQTFYMKEKPPKAVIKISETLRKAYMEEQERLSSVIPKIQQLKTCDSCLCHSFPNLTFWFYSEKFWLRITMCSCSTDGS